MEFFYATDIKDKLITLDENESRHCINVLRHKTGDSIKVTDGLGNLYTADIIIVEKRNCVAMVTAVTTTPPPPDIHIGISPVKNADRLDWFLEKVTEIGIAKVTPVLCKHTEKNKINYARMQKIMLSAMKQSGGCWLPELAEAISFHQFVDENKSQNCFICHNGNEVKNTLFTAAGKMKSITVMIGPEGGFNSDEIKEATNNNIIPVLLGNKRLRVETAGLVACTQANMILNN